MKTVRWGTPPGPMGYPPPGRLIVLTTLLVLFHQSFWGPYFRILSRFGSQNGPRLEAKMEPKTEIFFPANCGASPLCASTAPKTAPRRSQDPPKTFPKSLKNLNLIENVNFALLGALLDGQMVPQTSPRPPSELPRPPQDHRKTIHITLRRPSAPRS